ncbi:MAG: transcriptional regulator, TrmB domain protein [Marmoricola sp.]|jgi:predicted transcriptional regulator|nr:transcriptional regulator, TrmB domain protein [Marmoricola sp.]
MWQRLIEAGLDPKDAHFYMAVLNRGRTTIASAAREAHVSRTNGYDIANRLVARGLISRVETAAGDDGDRRSQSHLVANDPSQLLEEWGERRRVLDDLVPQLRALFSASRSRPMVRYLEGPAGIRTALFETLGWTSPIRGILSMRDLMAAPGQAAMSEYINERRSRKLVLHVVRTRGHDWPQGWPTSSRDWRVVRHAPSEYEFTMTTLIGTEQVVTLSSARESFAMVVESREYAELQQNFFSVLWQVSAPGEVNESGPP